MRIAASVVASGRSSLVVEQLASRCVEKLGGSPSDLGVLFATNHFEDELESAADALRRLTNVREFIGCTAESVVGTEREVEGEPAMALWLAHLPDVSIQTTHIELRESDDPDVPPEIVGGIEADPASRPALIVLADPFSFPVTAFLGAVNERFPESPVIGGMTSGVEAARQSVLIHNDNAYREGAVIAVLSGRIQVDTIVSQGCRPIGRPFVITAAEQNILRQLGGKPAMAMLNEVFAQANEDERRLMRQGIFVGQAINEYRETFSRGDFLVRNLLGADQRSGALAVADQVRIGRTVQFHVRDAKTADEDLKALLMSQAARPVAGALLFTCNGRGRRMFSEPSHDLNVVQAVLGSVPVAGFFAAGELGPVGGRNFIHGHTASIGLFREPEGVAS
ncbi:MAG: FIST C-terminal domain-containing protein [Phycisphaerae bacterium]|nr:FIST C-terminal domain-containing protein [Phycisphaerae bacterium]